MRCNENTPAIIRNYLCNNLKIFLCGIITNIHWFVGLEVDEVGVLSLPV